MENHRERYEKIEYENLSKYAMKSAQSTGREIEIDECPIRTCFQRDRDRIIHSNAFRRLKFKTQVFLSPEGDHYRTRLTHTLEVSQIARTMARALRLNEDLTEAAALGHDLGHTPFGHAGERVLNRKNPDRFVHAQHSVRVAQKLENNSKGLNLTYEVLDGIRCHTGGNTVSSTLEGQLVRFADKIGYINHDIEDAMRANILTPEDIPYDLRYTLGSNKSARLNTMVTSVIKKSENKPQIEMEPEIFDAMMKLHKFMFDNVYTNPIAKGEEGKAEHIIERLYDYYFSDPARLPGEYHDIVSECGAETAVCDYIAGMTDRYCVHMYKEIFIPKSWDKL